QKSKQFSNSTLISVPFPSPPSVSPSKTSTNNHLCASLRSGGAGRHRLLQMFGGKPLRSSVSVRELVCIRLLHLCECSTAPLPQQAEEARDEISSMKTLDGDKTNSASLHSDTVCVSYRFDHFCGPGWCWWSAQQEVHCLYANWMTWLFASLCFHHYPLGSVVMSCLDVMYHQSYGAHFLPAAAYKAKYYNHHHQQQQVRHDFIARRRLSVYSKMQECMEQQQQQGGGRAMLSRDQGLRQGLAAPGTESIRRSMSDSELKDGPQPAEAEYLSSRCVLFTYFQGDIGDVVDEHFSRALSQSSTFNSETKPIRVTQPSATGGLWKDGGSLSEGQSSSVWNSTYPSQASPCLPSVSVSVHPDFSPSPVSFNHSDGALWADHVLSQAGLPPPATLPESWTYSLNPQSQSGYPNVHNVYHPHPTSTHGTTTPCSIHTPPTAQPWIPGLIRCCCPLLGTRTSRAPAQRVPRTVRGEDRDAAQQQQPRPGYLCDLVPVLPPWVPGGLLIKPRQSRQFGSNGCTDNKKDYQFKPKRTYYVALSMYGCNTSTV
ncbi:hypothetical protein F7725_001834, partial [Dissostichus mawsoni]